MPATLGAGDRRPIAPLSVPDEQLDVALAAVGVGLGGRSGQPITCRIARGRVILDEGQPDDLAGLALEVKAAGRVGGQRVPGILQDARGALVARDVQVALLVVLHHEARRRALVHEDHLEFFGVRRSCLAVAWLLLLISHCMGKAGRNGHR